MHGFDSPFRSLCRSVLANLGAGNPFEDELPQKPNCAPQNIVYYSDGVSLFSFLLKCCVFLPPKNSFEMGNSFFGGLLFVPKGKHFQNIPSLDSPGTKAEGHKGLGNISCSAHSTARTFAFSHPLTVGSGGDEGEGEDCGVRCG